MYAYLHMFEHLVKYFQVCPIKFSILSPPLLHIDSHNTTFPSWGVDHTNHFRYHPLASSAVIMWKVVDQHLILNIIPNNFTAGTKRKVWCDQNMTPPPLLRTTTASHLPHWRQHDHLTFLLACTRRKCPTSPQDPIRFFYVNIISP